MLSYPIRLIANQKTAMMLIALIFLVAPFYYHDNIGGTGLNLPGNITVWFAASLFIWFALKQMLDRRTLILPQRVLMILAFPILATLSGFISGVSEPLDWVFRLVFIWGGVFFLIALFQFNFSRAQKDKLLYLIVMAGLLHAVVACLQIFQPEGMSIFLPKAPSNVATGVFQQINIHATFQATVLAVSWYLCMRPLAKRSLFIKSSILLTVGLATFIIISSGSRVGVISMFIGLALLIAFCWTAITANKKNIILLAIIMVLAATASVFTDGFGRLVDKSAVVHTEYKASQRIGIYKIAGELIVQKPIVGHGLGSFESVWQYQKAAFQQRYFNYELLNAYVTHPHNELLFWQVEAGALASIGILLSFLAILCIAWKTKARYAIAFLFPFALHNQVELPFHISASAWFVTLLLIYTALSHNKKHVAQSFLSQPMTKSLSLVNHCGLVLVIIFFGHTALSNYQLEQITKPDGHANLDIPLVNPYFTKIAEDFRMQQIFKQSSIDRNERAMKFFHDWQKQEIKNRPTDYNFKMLIAAYQNLQQPEQACQTAKLALNMYQNNLEFERYLDACQSDLIGQ